MNRTEPIYKENQITRFLDILHEQNPNCYIAALLQLNWGLRISDVLSLKIRDLIESENPLKIKDRVVIKEQKNRHERLIPINTTVKKALEGHIRARKEEKRCAFSTSLPLVESREKKNGEPKSLSRCHVHAVYSEAGKKAGIKTPVSTHSLRKTFAHQLYMSKRANIGQIQAILGHHSTLTTQLYAFIPQEEFESIYRRVHFSAGGER